MHIAELSQGDDGRQRHPRRGRAARLRRRAGRQVPRQGRGRRSASSATAPSNQGTFLESLNLAAVWNLPAIFVVENNGYAESTSRDYGTGGRQLRRPRAGLRHAGRDRRRHRFLRRVRGGRRDRSGARAKAAARRCSNARWSASTATSKAMRRPTARAGETRRHPRRTSDCLKNFAAAGDAAGVITAEPSSTAIDRRGRSS